MKKSQLKEMVREILYKVLEEGNPTTAPSKPKTEPAVHPGKPDTGKPAPRRPLGNPNVQPEPKAKIKKLNEEEIIDKIVKRFKSKK